MASRYCDLVATPSSYLVASRDCDLVVPRLSYLLATRLTWSWRIKKICCTRLKLSPFVVPTYIYFKLSTYQYLASDSILAIYLLKFFYFSICLFCPFSCLLNFDPFLLSICRWKSIAQILNSYMFSEIIFDTQCIFMKSINWQFFFSCTWVLLLLFILVHGIHISYFIISKVFLFNVTC